MKGTIFLSGKIAGDPEYKAKFQNAEEHFKKQGFKVINPATLPEGLTNTEYMRICFSMIEACDLVIFLPDWKYSLGAKLEHAYCEYTFKSFEEIGEG
ncbi:MAG: DUF4406 domain-containing protein [Clostridia bacterium]|nr:DUF4406 domain-containing protein [Clostridia bacterium]